MTRTEQNIGRSADGWAIDVRDVDGKFIYFSTIETYDDAKTVTDAARFAYPDLRIRLLSFFDEHVL